MVSSDSSTSSAASPSGMKLSVLATRVDVAREAVFEQVREHAFADSPGVAGLVDDQHPSGGVRLAQHVLHRQRRQPPQVDDAGGDPRASSRRATRRLIRTPLPKVRIVRSVPSP